MTPSKEELISLYTEQKLTLQQIADKFSVSKTKIYRCLHKYGIKAICIPRNKIISKEVLIDLYINQNKTTEEIAQELGLNRTTVSKWLRAAGVKLLKQIPVPPQNELYKLYIEEYKTLDEIGEIYKVNRNLISKWLNSYNIKIRLYGRLIEPPTKEILEILYLDEGLTINNIATLYDTNKSVITRWLNNYSICIRSNQRKFYHLKAIPFTDKQKELIIGTMLGDGHLAQIGKNQSVRLNIIHSIKQIDFFFHKKNIMGNFINNCNIYVEKKRNSTRIYCASIVHDGFKVYRKLFYDNNKKIIRDELINYFKSPFSLAIWVMDDGWKNHSNIRISSEGFSKTDNEKLARILKVNFDLTAKVIEYARNDKKYYYLSFNKENSIKLSNIIRPYIIDSMKYKLL